MKTHSNSGLMAAVPATAVAILIAIFLVLFTTNFADSFAAHGDPNAQFSGRLEGEFLQVSILLDRPKNRPLLDRPHVWIADLAKTPVALAVRVKHDASKNRIEATIPVSGWDPADRALYSLWYRIEDGDATQTGAASLREVFGSMTLSLLAPASYQVGTRGALRVVVTERHNNRPLPGVAVAANFVKDKTTRSLFSATTDASGTVHLDFPVPADLGDSATLEVQAVRGDETLKESAAVSFKRTDRILITSDKPLYQPGQVIHIRSLTLSQATRKPTAAVKATLEVEDAKGNKVFKKIGKTDRFGVFAADFQLARELNMGTYRLRAVVGDHNAEKTVDVKKYVLPKYKVAIQTDRAYYRPGQTVTGTVEADYIFGKPTAGAAVTLTGYASIVGANQFAQIKGTTDAQGRFAFEMTLPDYFVGQDVDAGLARAQFRAQVQDKAQHKQEALKSVTVSAAAINALMVPESGSLVQGVSNRLFIMLSRPDGSPARATVKDPWNPERLVPCDELGLVTLETPAIEQALSFKLEIRDDRGNEIVKHYNLQAGWDAKVLMRTDRPVYKVGQTARLTLITANTASSAVYVDVINNDQTVLTAAHDVKAGRATLDLPITPDMVGTLLLHAYIIDPGGNLLRDTRLVYVNAASDLTIGITPSKKQFRPGQKAAIDFAVTDAQGHPVAAALGVTIVDEAVFALQDMQPGFEKVFFTLEKELMKPRYEFHTFTPNQLVQEPILDSKRARGYEVMLASIEPAVSYGIHLRRVVPLTGKERQAMDKQVRSDLKHINAWLEQHVKKGASQAEAWGAIEPEQRTDPWGTPYAVLWYIKGQVVSLMSHGPDRRANTDDDIRIQDEKLGKKFGRRYRRSANRQGFFALGGAAPPDAGAVGDGMMLDEMVDFDGAMEGAAPMKGKMAEKQAGSSSRGASTPGIRVRKYFPETLFTHPALITDGRGRARIELDMADSITTWRIGTMAHNLDGLLGSTSAALRVFQDFFVDIDFPVALTRNDEVTVPIALYNYLKRPQTIKLTVEQADWYELLEGPSVRKIRMEPGEVRAVSLKLKANKVGRHKLTVYAQGSKLSDAIRRPVEVIPDGKKFETTFSDRLDGDVSHVLDFPSGSIEGADALFVKIYPGLMSQVIEGLDSILRMPGGCFEQTSSTTYPNIMVLDYMKTTGKITPKLRMKAEGFINQGYQRLLSFEVPGGGFEWFGNAPAHKILTAYGLMEFSDMSRVHNVDPAVISRTQRWLVAQQEKDGSWKPAQRFLDTVASKFTTDITRNTAYIAWALAKSDYQGPALAKALDYLEDNGVKADDGYTLALVANAFAYAKGRGKAFDAIYDKLMSMRKTQDGAVYWPGPEATAIQSRGKSAQIETTALVGQALIIADRAPQVINGIIKFLAQNKDTFGNWHSTQATVFALKVMIMSAEKSVRNVHGELSVTVNGRNAGGVSVTPENADVLKLIDATTLLRKGQNRVALSFGGEGQVMYQIVGRYFLPWKAPKPIAEPISIDVKYDKTSLRADDTVTCAVAVASHRPGDFGMVVVDLGVPPGFEVMAGDLAELVGNKTMAKFELTGRQVIVYLDRVDESKPVTFAYRLRAKYPVRAATPASRVYEYYNPQVQSIAAPVQIVVAD